MNAAVSAFEVVQQSYLVNHPSELFTDEQLRFGCGRGLPVIVDYAGVDAEHLSDVQRVARHLGYMAEELDSYKRVVVKSAQPHQWDKCDEFGVRKPLKRIHDLNTRTVTAYARRKYPKLYSALRELILLPESSGWKHRSPMNWEKADQLTALGYMVSYDKASNKATVQVGSYQMII